MNENGDRPLPFNADLERSVVCAVLADATTLDAVAAIVRPDDFYREPVRLIYEAALYCGEHALPVELLTVMHRLEEVGKLDAVGGAAGLADWVAPFVSSEHAEGHARIVADLARKRRLVAAAQRMIRAAFEPDLSAEEALTHAERFLSDVATDRPVSGMCSVADVLREYHVHLSTLAERKGAPVGVPTGVRDLDRLTSGLQPGDLVLLAGRPSVGKTALALAVARHAALRAHVPTVLFSLEMSRGALANRLLASEARVPSQKLRVAWLDAAEWEVVVRASGQLSEAPLWIDDTAALTVAEVRSRSRRWHGQRTLGLVVIDYLQLLGSSGRRETRQQEVAEISRALKALARELEVPVLALSQLSRAVESRVGHRPLLSDLRETGQLEQDADLVLFVHREDAYRGTGERDGLVELIVAKQRNGPTGSVSLRFEPAYQQFAGIAREDGQW